MTPLQCCGAMPQKDTCVQVGLPEKGTIFASHNQAFKVEPELFDVWMRIMKAYKVMAYIDVAYVVMAS